MIINIELCNNISVSFPVNRLLNGQQRRFLITQDYNMVNVIRPGQHFSLVADDSVDHEGISCGKILSVNTVNGEVVLEL